MKKFLALALAAAMSLSLVACGGNNDSQGGGSSSKAPGSASNPGSSSAAPVGDADFKVGAVYITSQNDVAGYTFQHHNGITAAMKALGLNPADLIVVDNVPDNDDTAVANAIDTVVNQGADIVFGISFGYIQPMADKSEEYQDVIFSHGTGYLANETNFNNYFGRIYQARYLAGVAAGMKSLELGNNSIGYVAAFNRQYAETCSGINAFALGAQSANPDAVVHVKTIDTWGDEALEKQAAQALVDAYNCCVISQHCDSAQPQLVAAQNNIFGCGYNSDMTEQAPTAHITAAIWHWNVYYQTAIQAAMDCNGDASKFVENMGGNAYYAGLAEGFVDASPVNEATAAPNTTAVMDAVRELIVSGEWDVFSGVKLSYNIGEDGSVEIVKTDAPLMSDGKQLVDGQLVDMEPEVVPAGGPSVDDGVIKGSMNYNVAGVVEG
ncbi:BMP family ABC transporter substrate-binding protein [Colidextribacter sp. OB.20]|uniref:BMP family ABC transporter substrate-binding protein n=1 Tax=Colidextribacter sp. OB.20 TaxID=2304568 RepID=UPI001370DAC2|nr:BMP family ABC transporter substrate-binding protein [Colidextribacter sp. OB.20]NBI08694.1 BMP family ABC transporter substrate-binding protein [Colidextribacter sp. OB.20]